jgi:hypothetical protein
MHRLPQHLRSHLILVIVTKQAGTSKLIKEQVIGANFPPRRSPSVPGVSRPAGQKSPEHPPK